MFLSHGNCELLFHMTNSSLVAQIDRRRGKGKIEGKKKETTALAVTYGCFAAAPIHGATLLHTVFPKFLEANDNIWISYILFIDRLRRPLCI